MAADPPPGRSSRSTATVNSSATRAQQQPASLARRLLFPQLPPDAHLPPLFASPACPPELHAEAYEFLALALRAFVHTWWTKITRYDRELLPEITILLTSVLRTLEARLLSADLDLLVFAVLPALVTQHYRDHRHAASKLAAPHAADGAVSLAQRFHQIQPHVAVSASGALDPVYFRQAFDHVLALCLPPQDYAPELERCLLREILLRVVVHDVIPQVTQPWFVHAAILDLLGPSQDAPADKEPPPAPHPAHFSYHSLLVCFLSAVQFISGICLALVQLYRQTLSTIKLVNQPARPSSSRTARSACSHDAAAPLSFIARQPLVMIAEILAVHERFATGAAMYMLSMISAAMTPFMDRLLTHTLHTRILSASSALWILRLSKRALFPNGYRGPPSVDPTPEEQTVIRQTLLRRLHERVPALAAPVLLGPSPERTLEEMINPLGDAACNRHLAVLVVDAVLLAMFPEMGVNEGID